MSESNLPRPPGVGPDWVLVTRDSSVYHTSGIARWVPPGDPAIDGRREEGHPGFIASMGVFVANEADLSDHYTRIRVEAAPTRGIEPIRLKTTVVPKGWGHEVHICNNNEFCGKELHINAGHQFSMHFHIKKREVFRLRSGKVFLDTIDLTNADQKRVILEPGDVVEIPRHLPHSIKAVEASVIDEYSTTHEDADSYRVMPGSSQRPQGWKS